MSLEALKNETFETSVEGLLKSPVGRARLIARFREYRGPDQSLRLAYGKLRDMVVDYGVAESSGADTTLLGKNILRAWNELNMPAPTGETSVAQPELETAPEESAVNEMPHDVIKTRVRRGLGAVSDEVMPANENIADIPLSAELPPVVPETPPETFEVADVDALRAEVEHINDEVGECNPLSLLQCEEYMEGYRKLYNEIQHRFFGKELSLSEAGEFKTFVMLLRDSKDEVLAVERAPEQHSQVLRGVETISPSVDVVSAPVSESKEAGSIVGESVLSPDEPAVSVLETSTSKEEPTHETALEPIVDRGDILESKEVTDALNAMLEDWFEQPWSFWGIRAGGIEHPEFQLLKGCLMEGIVEDDLKPDVRKGIKSNTIANIKQNIDRWRLLYKIFPDPRENFEHYLRRVVVASMDATVDRQKKAI